jgi:hypothetical protein
MSKEELVSAYLAGKISRRMFIRRLAAAGVSLGAAVSYAHLIAPEGASASEAATGAEGRDFYTPAQITVWLLSRDLERVRRRGELRARVRSDEAATVRVVAKLPHEGELRTIASTAIELPTRGRRVFTMAINRWGLRELEDREQATVRLIATARDLQGDVSFDTDRETLRA